MKKNSITRVVLLILVLVLVSQCERSPKEEFDLSLIPGTYIGGLILCTTDDSTGYISEYWPIQALDYKTTIFKNRDSIIFIFDPDCIMQIPGITGFQDGTYYDYIYFDRRLSISSIISEDYKIRISKYFDGSDGWKDNNYFSQSKYDNRIEFQLLLESIKSDTLYCLEVFGLRYY